MLLLRTPYTQMKQLAAKSNLVISVGSLIIIYLVIALTQTVRRNYAIINQIESTQAQTVLFQEQTQILEYNIQYYRTSAFYDRQARVKLGLQQRGEHLIIVPSISSLPSPLPSPVHSSNVRLWEAFLMGR